MKNRQATLLVLTMGVLVACGGGSEGATAIGSSPTPTPTPAPAPVIQANSSNYLDLLSTLKPGDTLLLAPGNYGVDSNGADTSRVPGLPILSLNGTESAPITITGPETGPRPVLLGRSTHNTVRISGSSHVVIRNIEIDNRGNNGAHGISSQGISHHITLENLYIHGVGNNQQIVGIAANSAASWNWVIRNNQIVGAGTGMYLGSSSGNVPFVAGLIEHNLIRDTIGYNIEIKHQFTWSSVPTGIPTTATTTFVRHNVFSKLSSFVSSDGARPNLLVGAQPPSGPGAENGYEIYGNFFYQNPTESLFQGEGNIAFHHNVMVNDYGTAVRVQTHNGTVRMVRIFSNTIVSRDTGISVSGGLAGTTQRVAGNAVFAGSPISVSGADAAQTNNITGSQASASAALNNPTGALGVLDLHPKAEQLQGVVLDTTDLSAYTAWDRDFNGTEQVWLTRGAYSGSGTNPGWLPRLEVKP